MIPSYPLLITVMIIFDGLFALIKLVECAGINMACPVSRIFELIVNYYFRFTLNDLNIRVEWGNLLLQLFTGINGYGYDVSGYLFEQEF